MATTPCANCGVLVPAGAAACPSCGTPTTAPVAPPPPPPPPGPPGQPPAAPPQGFPPAAQPGFAAPGAPTPAPPAAVPPVYQQPAHQPAPGGAAGPQPASGRNRTAGLLAVIGFGVVLLGTFLPIVEFDLGDLGNFGGVVDESLNGWSGDINDGPIHLFFGLIPLVLGILVLKNGAKIWMKVLLIISAVIGYFWILVRFADISGSLEEETGASDFVAEVSDPGIGLYILIIGWTLVLIAGIVAKKAPIAYSPDGQAYPPPPTA